MTQNPRINAVLVGVDRPHDWPAMKDLRGAARNGVETLAARLHTEFQAETVVELVGSDATKIGIGKAIQETLVDGSRDGDVAIFYFTGHGMRKRRSGAFLAAFDTAWFTEENKTNAILASTRFSIQDLVEAFAGLKPGAQIEAIFDTCFAGGAADRWQRLRWIARGPADGVISFLRRTGVRNPWALHYQIEKALRGRQYVLWLSSSQEQESHAVDVGGRLVGAFTSALDSALETSRSGDAQRRKTLRTIRDKVAASKQAPSLAPSEEQLRRRPIFDFGGQAQYLAASDVTRAS